MILLLLLLATATADNITYQDFADANNRFAPDIYKEIASNETNNVIMSPLSAETVLALLLAGCKGATAQELRSVLHLPNNEKNEIKDLIADLQSSYHLSFDIANAVFLQQNFEILSSYREVATEDFHAKIENLDFARNTEAANTINQWVEKVTKNTIKNLVDPNSLSGATRLVLVNALHFKGNWSVQFLKGNTAKKNFHRSETEVIQVDTLHLSRKNFNYHECECAQYLELFFEGNEASMVFIVPKKIGGLKDVEKEGLFASIPFKSTYLNIEIPKFKFEYKIDFKEVLQRLGARKIFNGNEADLSGIAGNPHDLVVSEVVQKAYIDLNEGGVEAAAATAVGVVATSAINQTPKEFKADRPFFFYMKSKGVITFTGKVTNPKY